MTTSALRTTCAVVLVAGLSLATAGPVLASGLADPETSTENGQTVLVLDDTETSSQFIPKGGEPTDEFPQHEPSAGDGFAFTDDLRQHGTLVATDQGTCTITAAEQATCEVVVTFADGTISSRGTSTFDDNDSVFPLTGGTGAYEGIEGTATVHDFSDSEDPSDTKSTITLRFTVPAGQVEEVPAGGAATGGGVSGDGVPVALFALAGAGLLSGAGLVGLGRRTRSR